MQTRPDLKPYIVRTASARFFIVNAQDNEHALGQVSGMRVIKDPWTERKIRQPFSERAVEAKPLGTLMRPSAAPTSEPSAG